MNSPCLTRLRRRSRSGFDIVRASLLALAVGGSSWGAANAQAAAPIFPNMGHTVGEGPITVATADLDHDGIRDLIVANRGTEDLSVLRGLGGGDFGPEWRVPTGGIPVALAIADFNRDGRDDVAAALPVLDRVAIFLTGVNGLPGAPLFLVAGDSPGALVAVDLDRDGKTDLVATNYLSDNVTRWKGYGDGTFGPGISSAAGVRPDGLIATLLNGDLNPDIVVASNGTDEAIVLVGDGAGGFLSPAPYPTYAFGSGGHPRKLLAADVDGDGAVDLFVTKFELFEDTTWLILLHGRGDGSLAEGEVVYRGGDGPFTLAAADFNRDGRVDLAVGSHHGASCCFTRNGSILLGQPQGSFEPANSFRSGVGPVAAAIDDFDHDGIADIAAISDAYWAEVAINLGQGDGAMGREPELLDPGFAAFAVATGDVDGDGWLDLVSIGFGSKSLHVLRGAGAGQFHPAVVMPAGQAPGVALVDDFNGDTLDDICVRDFATDTVLYFRSLGGGGFASAVPLAIGKSVGALASGDVTGDGAADLLIVGPEDQVLILSRPGESGFEQRAVDSGTPYLRSIATGDFDGDGRRDIAVSGTELAVLSGLGDGTFTEPRFVAESDLLSFLKAGDVDADGHDDLVYHSARVETRLLLGKSDGSFLTSSSFEHRQRPNDLTLADFDSDGTLDLVEVDEVTELADLAIVLNPPGTPGLVARRIVANVGQSGIVAGDYDHDGRIDIVACGNTGLLLIRNQGPFPNHAPHALPAATTTVECTGPGGASVTLDGSGSTDPDSTSAGSDDIATYEWFEDFDTPGQRLVATGALAAATLTLGGHDLTLRVTDHAGATDTANLIVDVVDTVAPAVGAAMSPGRLWPPNHEYANVRANVSAIDACGPVTVTLVSARSSEPDDMVGGGDGATRNDIAGAALGTADFDLRLRAERDGLGSGRTYTLVYRVVDAAGNATEASAEVFVPVSPAGRGGVGAPPQGGGSSNGGANGNGAPGGHGNGYHGGSGQPRGPRPRPGSSNQP